MTEEKHRRKPPANGWKPGQSGNPAGRPRGVGKVAALRASIEAQLPALLDAAVARALAGDIGATRLLLERVLPPLKAVEQGHPLALPAGTLTEQGQAVLAAVSSGELAPGQGAALLSSIGTLARVSEVDDLARRIEALEARNIEGKG